MQRSLQNHERPGWSVVCSFIPCTALLGFFFFRVQSLVRPPGSQGPSAFQSPALRSCILSPRDKGSLSRECDLTAPIDDMGSKVSYKTQLDRPRFALWLGSAEACVRSSPLSYI